MKKRLPRKGIVRRETAPAKEEPQGDVFFYAANLSDGSDKDFEDIILRRVPRAVAHRFRGAAGARGLTHAQYLSALVNLHDLARRRSEDGDESISAILHQLGLQTVSI